MAKTILNFHFDYLKPSLIHYKDLSISCTYFSPSAKPNKVKFDQDIKDSAAGGELNRFIRCPSVDHLASKFSQPSMRAIF